MKIIKNNFIEKLWQKVKEIFPLYVDSILIVGGSVRDALLEKESNDIDLVCSDSRIFEFLHLKPNNFFTVKKDMGFHLTISLPRKEYLNLENKVSYVPLFSLQKKDIFLDAFRRDLTINAIYLDLFGNILDPFHAQNDMEKGLLQIINPVAFWWDVSRILRLIRYEFLTKFSLTTRTLDALKECLKFKKKINQMEKHRLKLELRRTLSIMSYNELKNRLNNIFAQENFLLEFLEKWY